MRTLQQIASECYIEYTMRDIDILDKVRTETLADIVEMLPAKQAEQLVHDFWKRNPKGR